MPYHFIINVILLYKNISRQFRNHLGICEEKKHILQIVTYGYIYN